MKKISLWMLFHKIASILFAECVDYGGSRVDTIKNLTRKYTLISENLPNRSLGLAVQNNFFLSNLPTLFLNIALNCVLLMVLL